MLKNLLGAVALVAVIAAGFLFTNGFGKDGTIDTPIYVSAPLSIRPNIALDLPDKTTAPLRVSNVASVSASSPTVTSKDTSVDQMMAIILQDLRNSNATTAPAVTSRTEQQPDTNQAITASATTAPKPLNNEDLLQALVNRSLVSANVSDISRTVLSQTSLDNAKRHKVKRGESLATIAIKYYGNKDGYKAIFAANKATLKSPNRIRIGQVLLIPDL